MSLIISDMILEIIRAFVAFYFFILFGGDSYFLIVFFFSVYFFWKLQWEIAAKYLWRRIAVIVDIIRWQQV